MKATATKGFTLIELAVVIAIVAILAAVAIPKFQNSDVGAQRAVIKDMVSNLNSASSIYTARTGTFPAGFSDYVQKTGAPTGNMTLSLQSFGNGTGCTIATDTITCAGTFSKWDPVTYTFNGGAITATATAKGHSDPF